jgi:predicted DNA-binding protein with PD1-like motif
MNIRFTKTFVVLILFVFCLAFTAQAQDYVSPTQPAEIGKAPGMKVKLVSTNEQTKTYAVVFSPGDEVRSGLTEFAQKYNVSCAHYTAIGDASTCKVGWYDIERKMFKVIPINEPAEITSLIGDIALFNGKPVAHSHVTLATSDGICHGGHLLEIYVGPTLEVFVTVEPTPLYKKLDPKFNAGVIDPALEK